jgi:hypothetical protein
MSLVWPVMACAGPPDDVSRSGEEDPTVAQQPRLFDDSPEWKKYSKLYDKIGSAKSLRSLEKLWDQADDRARDLEAKLPGDPIVADLSLLLESALQTRESILQPSPGRQPRTDYAGKLRSALPRTRAHARVAERLLEAGVDDAWVVRNLYAGLVSSISGTDYLVRRLTLAIEDGDLEGTSELRDLIEQAEATLESARAVEQRVPEEARAAAGA